MAPRPLLTPRRATALTILVPALVGLLLVADDEPPPARAEVVHQDGFRATVLGWTSWYGSYGVGSEGPAWCVDHGRRAPDEAHGYVPTDLDASPDVRAAMAWAVSRHATGDRVGAAALMLALHDLAGARYPFGPLDVHAMDIDDLAGFDGLEAPVLERSRRIKDDALAHAALRAPLRLEIDAPAVEPGEEANLALAVRDAHGRGVDGVVLDVAVTGATALTETRVATGGDGQALVRFRTAEGSNHFRASGFAPDPSVRAWAPVRADAQRVVRPGHVALSAETAFDARPPTGWAVVVKTGEADAYLDPAGGVFQAQHPDGTPVMALVTGSDGRSPAAELPVGRYRLVETRPPAGYDVAPPVDFEVRAGETTEVAIFDPARRTEIVLEKRDAHSGELLAGAELRVAYDADRSGDHETEIARMRTRTEPVTVGDLLPGDYEITELRPPPHHLGLDEPLRVTVTADQPGRVVVENRPTTTVSFEKVPERRPPDDRSLAGADFEVYRASDEAEPTGVVDAAPLPPTTTSVPEGQADAEHREPVPALAGSCTTDESGRCRLPDDVLLTGEQYCWRETRAPAGYGLAEGDCFTAAEVASPMTLTVVEPLVDAPPVTAPPSTPPPSRPPEDRPPVAPPTHRSDLPVTGGPTTATATVATTLVLVGAVLASLSHRRRGARHGAQRGFGTRRVV